MDQTEEIYTTQAHKKHTYHEYFCVFDSDQR